MAIAIAIGCLLLAIFVPALIQSHPGEVAAAIGSILGGIVGAGGAVGAVYLLINQQQRKEANNVSNAIRREITECSKIVINALAFVSISRTARSNL